MKNILEQMKQQNHLTFSKGPIFRIAEMVI